MLIVKHQVKTSIKPESVWRIWEDVENWNTWDDGLEFSSIEGPFITGAPGTLKPKGGPVLKTRLSLVDPMKIFVDEAKLPLTKVTMTHTLEKQGDQTIVTQIVEMKGILALFFAFVIGRDIKKNLPSEMESMLKKAKRLEAE